MISTEAFKVLTSAISLSLKTREFKYTDVAPLTKMIVSWYENFKQSSEGPNELWFLGVKLDL
jgi:hypothetical protein